MSSYTRIKVARSGHVETITLAYPEKRNALGPVLVNELLHALESAFHADAVRVVVLAGEGKDFCAGGDFGEMRGALTAADGAPPLPPPLPAKGDYADLVLALAQADKPVIARVHGAAMGGGLGLVAASAFAIASTDAQFGTPEVNVGLFPMMIMAVLARLVPRRKLLSMMTLGEKLGAAEALEVGIVGTVVEPTELDAAVDALAAKIASKSPTALRLGLRGFADQDGLELSRALPLLRDRLAECLGTEDAQEGLAAFVEKRLPSWKGR